MGFDEQGYWTLFKVVFALAVVGAFAIVKFIWQLVTG
jgi:hypothetical protein